MVMLTQYREIHGNLLLSKLGQKQHRFLATTRYHKHSKRQAPDKKHERNALQMTVFFAFSAAGTCVLINIRIAFFSFMLLVQLGLLGITTL